MLGGSWVPLLNFEGGSRGPGPTFTPCRKNRRGLTQVQAIKLCMYCKQIRDIDALLQQGNVFRALYWHNKCKINRERTFKHLHDRVIYRKSCFFLGLSKKSLEGATGVFYKKAVLNNFEIFTQKHLCWSLF